MAGRSCRAGKLEELADDLVKDPRLRLCSVTYGVVIVVSSCVLAWGYRGEERTREAARTSPSASRAISFLRSPVM
jgi:hypothetical protein